MNRGYQDILKRHKVSLQDQLQYDERFAKAVLDEHVLPATALREVEKEVTKAKRLQTFLYKLSQQDNAAFHKFVYVLEQYGYSDIALSFKEDIKHIHWEFQKSASMLTIPELSDHVIADILPQLLNEKDSDIFQALIKEVEHSVAKIRLIERGKSKFTRRLARIANVPDVNEHKPSDDHSEKLLEEVLCDVVKEKLETLELDKKYLAEKIEIVKEELQRNVEKMKISAESVNASHQQNGHYCKDKDVAYLTDVIHKQDVELLTLRNERKNSANGNQQDTVQISRHEFEHIMATLTVYTKHRSSLGSDDSDSHTLLSEASVQDNGTQLMHHVTSITRTVDRLRERVNQMTRWIAELEKDRQVILNALPGSNHENNNKEFARLVTSRLHTLHSENESLEAELKSLRSRMTSMADEQTTMIEKLAATSNGHTAKEETVATPRQVKRRGLSTPSVVQSQKPCTHHNKNGHLTSLKPSIAHKYL